jgi:hypothetical protein
VIVQQQDDQLVVEALGILGNLTLMDLDYLKIIEEFRLLPFISSVLQAPKVEDDVTLEVIILVGTLSIDETTASVLASQGIIELLIDLLKGELVGVVSCTLLCTLLSLQTSKKTMSLSYRSFMSSTK